MVFRALRPEEIQSLRNLNLLFAEAFEDFESYQHNLPDDDYLRKLLARDNFIAMIAEEDGQLAGGLAAYVLDKFEQNRSEVYIYDLAVAEPFRRRKIATRLIENLKGIAREKNAWVIYVQADYEDEPAVRLYESLGIKEEVLHFDIPCAESTK